MSRTFSAANQHHLNLHSQIENDQPASDLTRFVVEFIAQLDQPGFVTVDLVAHYGDTTEGYYLDTLAFTGIATGWTELLYCRIKWKPLFIRQSPIFINDCLCPYWANQNVVKLQSQ